MAARIETVIAAFPGTVSLYARNLDTGASFGVRSDERVPVVATARGRFMGHLAERGERVRDGQPLAWIRLAV